MDKGVVEDPADTADDDQREDDTTSRVVSAIGSVSAGANALGVGAPDKKESAPKTANGGGTDRKTKSGPRGLHSGPGRRVMKEYPVTFNELITLGGLSTISTVCFSCMGFCATTWWQLQQEFAFSPPTAVQAAHWHGVMDMMQIGVFCFGTIGALMVILGGINVFNIWRETTHTK